MLSYLHNPVIDNGHSLEAWGKRLDFPKLSHDDYSTYSPEMETYCKQDVDLTEKLYDHFMEQVSDFSKKSVELEHTVRRVIDIQQDNGFYLDQPKASILLAQLKDESGIIEDELVKEEQLNLEVESTDRKIKYALQSISILDSFIEKLQKQKLEEISQDFCGIYNEITDYKLDIKSIKKHGRYQVIDEKCK